MFRANKYIRFSLSANRGCRVIFRITDSLRILLCNTVTEPIIIYRRFVRSGLGNFIFRLKARQFCCALIAGGAGTVPTRDRLLVSWTNQRIVFCHGVGGGGVKCRSDIIDIDITTTVFSIIMVSIGRT